MKKTIYTALCSLFSASCALAQPFPFPPDMHMTAGSSNGAGTPLSLRTHAAPLTWLSFSMRGRELQSTITIVQARPCDPQVEAAYEETPSRGMTDFPLGALDDGFLGGDERDNARFLEEAAPAPLVSPLPPLLAQGAHDAILDEDPFAFLLGPTAEAPPLREPVLPEETVLPSGQEDITHAPVFPPLMQRAGNIFNDVTAGRNEGQELFMRFVEDVPTAVLEKVSLRAEGGLIRGDIVINRPIRTTLIPLPAVRAGNETRGQAQHSNKAHQAARRILDNLHREQAIELADLNTLAGYYGMRVEERERLPLTLPVSIALDSDLPENAPKPPLVEGMPLPDGRLVTAHALTYYYYQRLMEREALTPDDLNTLIAFLPVGETQDIMWQGVHGLVGEALIERLVRIRLEPVADAAREGASLQDVQKIASLMHQLLAQGRPVPLRLLQAFTRYHGMWPQRVGWDCFTYAVEISLPGSRAPESVEHPSAQPEVEVEADVQPETRSLDVGTAPRVFPHLVGDAPRAQTGVTSFSNLVKKSLRGTKRKQDTL